MTLKAAVLNSRQLFSADKYADYRWFTLKSWEFVFEYVEGVTKRRWGDSIVSNYSSFLARKLTKNPEIFLGFYCPEVRGLCAHFTPERPFGVEVCADQVHVGRVWFFQLPWMVMVQWRWPVRMGSKGRKSHWKWAHIRDDGHANG